MNNAVADLCSPGSRPQREVPLAFVLEKLQRRITDNTDPLKNVCKWKESRDTWMWLCGLLPLLQSPFILQKGTAAANAAVDAIISRNIILCIHCLGRAAPCYNHITSPICFFKNTYIAF